MSPISSNENRSPYWNDYSPSSNYYQVVFQPGVSVQTRELNVLQSMLQNQIEQFGDNILSSGTIVSGCNFQYFNPYPYIQLNDLDVFNQVVVPSSYLGLNIINETNNLQATILNYANGFQTTPPNLKTLYIKYINTGNTGANLTAFSPGDVLTVYNAVTNPIEDVVVVTGGSGFSNSNPLVSVSALIVTINSGNPTVGQFLNNGNGIANVQIQTVNATAFASTNQAIITVAPRSVDLANAQCNSQCWTFNVFDTLTNPSNSFSLTVNQIIGSGLQGNIITNSIGTIIDTSLFASGVGYVYEPYITVQSPGNPTGYAAMNLISQNFVTQLIVSAAANSVGNGYAFGVTQGVVYQKGYFLQVAAQQILIDKYDQLPDNVAVGFITNEAFINYNTDQTLLDQANGSGNFQAPGADRLQLIPQLQTMAFANAQANSQFFPLVQWKAGLPYLQNQVTVYSTIGDVMAQRTEEVSGDFVVDPFVVTTQSPANTAQEGEFFNAVIDPGLAYISGYRIATTANFNINDKKGIHSIIVNNHAVSLNYGNYLTINNVAGSWSFNIGDSVNLYDTPRAFYSTLGGNLNPLGNKIGTANMRSMLINQGAPGNPSTTYNLYLFNVNMNAGANFANVASISYAPSSTNTAIGDVIQSVIGNGNNATVMQGANADQLVFYSGLDSLKNANNVSYSYRTANTSLSAANGNASNATIIIDISSGSETFPYGSGALSNIQLQDFYVVPTGADWLEVGAVAGTANVVSGTSLVNGTSTSFTANLAVGDYVYVSNNTAGHVVSQINSIVNNTTLTLVSNVGFSNNLSTLTRVFPQSVPIPFGYRAGLSGNVNTNENIITLSFDRPFTFSANSNSTVAFNVSRSNNPTQTTKTANRNQYVMISTSNNAAGATGPWCLGVPDVFRLRGVFIGNSTVSNTSTNYVSNFYVEHGQTSDFYNLSNLYLQQGSGLTVNTSSFLLVQFDYFTGGTGFYDTVSYTQSSNSTVIFAQDSLPLANLTTFVNSFEVPELFFDDGTEVDLLQYIDFRPYVANTVQPATIFSSAPVNPSNTVSLSITGEKKFPVPSSNFIATIEGWEGRVDSIYVDDGGVFSIGTGNPAANLSLASPPVQPDNTLKLVDIAIPSYPNLPTNLGINIAQILDTNIVSNQKFTTSRVQNKTVFNLSANSTLPYNQPERFTQAELNTMNAQLQQLQYYVSLNTLETNTASMTIPSSVIASENRQAYGIFTDDFTTSSFSDLSNPAYEAIKQGTNIVPSKMEWDLSLTSGSIPYIQNPIIQQDIATVGGIKDPLGMGPICALNLANTVAYTTLFRNASDLAVGSNTDTISVKMADSATLGNSITSIAGTITQSVLNNQYNPFSGSAAIFKNFKLTSDPTQNNPLELIESNGITSYSYNPQTKVLTLFNPDASLSAAQDAIVDPGGHNTETFTIPNISQTVADALGQALAGQITWAQFVGLIQTNQSIPGGGLGNLVTSYQPPVAFYFYNYTTGTQYNIYQGTTLIASTDPTKGVATCQDLVAADIALLTSSAANFWFNDNTALFMQNFQQLGAYASFAGKILFNYNPANGANFTVVSQAGAGSFQWRWVLAYPIDGKSVGCVPPVVTPVYTTYTVTSTCGNGEVASGQVQILSGFTSTWNPANPLPTTSIVPFSAAADWSG